LPTIETLFEKSPSRGVYARRPLLHWEELLEEWCLVHERYCRLVSEDAIYWNGERPNIAALAAAAWRCGWAALEEFAQPKTAKRSRFAGRTDLYMRSPISEDYVEAKCGWINVSSTKGNATGFLNAYRAARADARNVHLKPGKHRRIGVAFASVYTSANSQSSVSSGLASVISKLGDEKFEAAAWCFPIAAQGLKSTEAGVSYLYPGVVVLAGAV